jgi:hypothetical protein
MQRLEVSGAVRHIYIYIYMSLGVKRLIQYKNIFARLPYYGVFTGSYRRFGAIYQSHFQAKSIQRKTKASFRRPRRFGNFRPGHKCELGQLSLIILRHLSPGRNVETVLGTGICCGVLGIKRYNTRQTVRNVGCTVLYSLWSTFRGGVVIKALRYKPACRGFDSRWCHWNFSVT